MVDQVVRAALMAIALVSGPLASVHIAEPA
jgi:hypothetical protein